MSLLDKFLSSGKGKAYEEGMSLLEDGRFAEAVDRLRVVALGRADSPSGSLASFHFRQALLAEGRRLLREEQPAAAIAFFSEAVRLWDQYPDLHCLHGAACGFAGQWDVALDEARHALRINPDYVEARLLETVSLRALGRSREAAVSLTSLSESGRRIDHWLVDTLGEKSSFKPETLPEDLEPLLARALSGRSEKEEVAEAVALCRQGKWEAGRESFAALVARRPRYPDYRTRHAAALYQLNQTEAAMSEIEAALALNPTYRTAIDLKGLVLADSGRIREAADFLTEADRTLSDAKPASAHEELFGAYLRAVLALLLGRTKAVGDILSGWPDLLRNFARAELLLAAADDLGGRATTCGRRLADLADEWSAEPLYFHLLACHHLQHRRYRDVAGVLSRWPSAAKGEAQHQYLSASLAIFQGRAPEAVQETASGDVPAESWEFLRARLAYLAGEDGRCWEICHGLAGRGYHTEAVLRLQTLAAVGASGPDTGGWGPEPVLPDSCLPPAIFHHLRLDRTPEAEALLGTHLRVHPDFLTGYWLQPAFWLGPIRNWIA